MALIALETSRCILHTSCVLPGVLSEWYAASARQEARVGVVPAPVPEQPNLLPASAHVEPGSARA